MARGNDNLFAISGLHDQDSRKKILKIFSETTGPMVLGLGMQHWGHGPIKVSKHNNFGLT